MNKQAWKQWAAGIALLASGYALQTTACTADVFRAVADGIDNTNSSGDLDLGDWLADELDGL